MERRVRGLVYVLGHVLVCVCGERGAGVKGLCRVLGLVLVNVWYLCEGELGFCVVYQGLY